MKRSALITAIVLISFWPGPMRSQINTLSEKCIPCEKLTDLRFPEVRITEAVAVPGTTGHCRVKGIIGKEINFELLLPDFWNNIFIMGGGGGFVGTVQNAARSSVNSGYATSGTDTGHEATGSLSAEWAYNNMERQLNFGHLAIHRTAEVSKALIASYYGNYPDYSYFIGCSRGGGQAMMEAQRYPEDFDGIVVGAPAFNWPAIAAEFVQNTQAVFPEKLSKPIVTGKQIQTLHRAVIDQCDMIDGVKDSILNNPNDCNFNFDLLPKCPGDVSSDDCFTVAQINAIKKIYEGVDAGNGVSYPGFPFGAEGKPGNWVPWIIPASADLQESDYPTLHSGFGIEIFKYLILNDPGWDYRQYDFRGYEKEILYASAYLDATSTDYSGFRNRNGRIIFWHGWNDAALSAYATIDHYEAVKADDPGIDEYMRLYLLPGVIHCGGGDGPSQVDWILLIRDWVENGNPPGRIVLSKSLGGNRFMTRPVYPYPDEAVYDGNGDPAVESSFVRR